MKHTKNLLVLKTILFLVALLWTGIVAFFCLIKSSTIPLINIPFFDKFVHAFFHFVFAIVWFFYFKTINRANALVKSIVSSVLLSFVFGVFIEIMQQNYTTTRHADILDVVFNVIGSLIGVFFVLQWFQFKLGISFNKK
jgi:VanZ family protein